MGLINDLFQEWTKNHKGNTEYDKITAFIKENDIEKYTMYPIKDKEVDKENFLKYLLHSKKNGLGSHGGNYVDLSDNNTKLIAKTIQEIKQKENFEYPKDSKDIGNLGFKSEKRNMPIVYNRVLCALKPEELCNIPGEKQVDSLLKKLNEIKEELIENSVKIIEPLVDDNNKLKDNWYKKNNAICKILNFEIESKDDFISKRNNFAWHLYTHFSTDFSISKQIVKYGAPGTGKTYLTKQECEDYFDSWKINKNYDKDFNEHFEFVQFHPSYTYEDFIEGIRPTGFTDKGTTLELKDGIFKSFCKKAAKWEFELYKLGLGMGNDDESFEKITVKDVKEKGLETAHLKSIIEGRKDDELIKDLIPPFFFVIDEINRAELSRVFGELMYCLEYRGYNGKVKTQYSELATEKNIFYKEEENNYFFIPHNVYIIGTMNTIDRSVESFDFALRRRFLWQRIEPNYEVLREYFNDKEFNQEEANIIDGLENLNEIIAKNPLLGMDYQIGHSYLMKLEQYTGLKPKQYKEKIWEKHIQPILEEYFRGMGENNNEIKELKEVFAPKEEKKSTKKNDQTS